MKVLKIEEPYWSAWQKYGWEEKVAGIGISNTVVGQALHEGSNVYLYVGKDTTLYQIDPLKIIALAKQYKSIKQVGKGTVRVAVIPINVLSPVQGLEDDVHLIDSPPPRTLGLVHSRTVRDLKNKIEKMRLEAEQRRNSLNLGI